MTRLIDVLREEHRNIEKLLLVLEQELTVFDRRERPDFDTLRAVIDYFEEYPARCHHPKEDMMVDLLRVRDPVFAAAIGDIETDHREEADSLLALARTIESVRTGCDLPRDSVVDVVREFIAHERHHMAIEERELFPAALRALRPSDWASIEARMGDEHDPLFNGTSERKFRSLADKILRWERENEDGRQPSLSAKS
jgi:hemerythrin-like domain-containing protein